MQKQTTPGILTLAELRWRMFSKKQADSEKLPPTLATLEEKLNGAHYISLQWKSSLISNPSLPDSNEKIFEPVMRKLAATPESMLQR